MEKRLPSTFTGLGVLKPGGEYSTNGAGIWYVYVEFRCSTVSGFARSIRATPTAPAA